MYACSVENTNGIRRGSPSATSALVAATHEKPGRRLTPPCGSRMKLSSSWQARPYFSRSMRADDTSGDTRPLVKADCRTRPRCCAMLPTHVRQDGGGGDNRRPLQPVERAGASRLNG